MVFSDFPENPEVYAEDMQFMVGKTIEAHGRSEWRSAVLTNELHGHLGIYTLIGVKMGVKAREYLEAKFGRIHIESSAGIVPPVSCINDGLQVSTGATFGHGLISSPPTENALPEAVFRYNGKIIRMKLKPSVLSEIQQEITGAVKKYGHSGEYWKYVRKLAIRYWYELDRNEIFEIHEVR